MNYSESAVELLQLFQHCDSCVWARFCRNMAQRYINVTVGAVGVDFHLMWRLLIEHGVFAFDERLTVFMLM